VTQQPTFPLSSRIEVARSSHSTLVDAAPLIIIVIRTQHSSRTLLNQMHTTTGHAGYGIKAVILAVVGLELATQYSGSGKGRLPLDHYCRPPGKKHFALDQIAVTADPTGTNFSDVRHKFFILNMKTHVSN
jgi:hypothetical protein